MTSAWYIPGSTSAVSARRSVSGWTRKRPPWRGGQRPRVARRSSCLGRCRCQEEGDWAKVTFRYFVFNREDRVCIQMRWGYHCFILSSAHNQGIWEISLFFILLLNLLYHPNRPYNYSSRGWPWPKQIYKCCMSLVGRKFKHFSCKYIRFLQKHTTALKV